MKFFLDNIILEQNGHITILDSRSTRADSMMTSALLLYVRASYYGRSINLPFSFAFLYTVGRDTTLRNSSDGPD